MYTKHKQNVVLQTHSRLNTGQLNITFRFSAINKSHVTLVYAQKSCGENTRTFSQSNTRTFDLRIHSNFHSEPRSQLPCASDEKETKHDWNQTNVYKPTAFAWNYQAHREFMIDSKNCRGLKKLAQTQLWAIVRRWKKVSWHENHAQTLQTQSSAGSGYMLTSITLKRIFWQSRMRNIL